MKGIELCAECVYYSMKSHKCTRGCKIDPDIEKGEDVRFFVDCPLPDVQLVVHAYWIELPKALNPNENPCKCSNCGHIRSFMNGYPKSKYCDECGAKMDIIYEDDKVRAIKATGWNNDARNLTDKETYINNNRLEAEAETIDEISLL